MDQPLRMALAALMVVSLTLPLAGATWYNDGQYEPDTTFDQSGGYMWANPDTDVNGQKVYFSAWAALGPSGTAPNTGLTGSRIYPAPAINYHAYLGIWKDCNRDNYIGTADSALIAYPAALPGVDPGICPPGSAFNLDGWIHEFRWIAPTDHLGNDTRQALFVPPGTVNDTEARIWHELNLPGFQAGNTCPINPLPAGTTASTGGMIDYADCFIGQRVRNSVNAADPNDALGLNFGQRPQASDSLLNQQLPHLWHDPYHPDSTGIYERDSEDAAFTTFDCSQQSEVALPTGQLIVSDPTGGELPSQVADENGTILTVGDEDGVIFRSGTPAPAVHNPQGSYYDGINNTWNSDCPDDGSGSFTYANVEGQHGGTDGGETGRAKHDTSFVFTNYGLNPHALDDDQNACIFDEEGTDEDVPAGCEDIDSGTDGTIPAGTPKDGGLTAQRGPLGLVGWGPGWRGTTNWVTTPQSVNRNTLQPQGPAFSTFYATVGAATFATGAITPASTAGIYGKEWCGSATTGIVKGFDCDPDHWWNPLYDPAASAGTRQTGGTISTECTTGLKEPIPNCREMSVKPGQPYYLRDIDCLDGSVARGVPVYASLVQIAGDGSVCPDAS